MTGVDNTVAVNLPSFEWYRLVRAAIESSFDRLAVASSTNLTNGTAGISVVALGDGTSSIQIQSGSLSSTFVISESRLASCLGTIVSEVYQRSMSSYQTLYQYQAVDVMNKKLILEQQISMRYCSNFEYHLAALEVKLLAKQFRIVLLVIRIDLASCYWATLPGQMLARFVFVLSACLGHFIGLLWHYYILHQQCVVSIDGNFLWLLI